MKRLLSITLALASLGFVASSAETKANTLTKATNPQFRIQVGPQRRRYRDDRYRDRYRDNRLRDNRYNDYNEYNNRQVFTQTRLVNDGWHTYRETYQTRYLPDGRTQTFLISRARVN